MRLVTKQGVVLNPRYVRALRAQWNKALERHEVTVLDDHGDWLDLDGDPGDGEYDEVFEPVIASTGVLYAAFGPARGDAEPTDQDLWIEQHAIIGWRLSSVARCEPTPITATGSDLEGALLTAVQRPDGELDGPDANYPNLAAFRAAALAEACRRWSRLKR